MGLIEEFTARMDFGAFIEDPKTIAAVERKLLVISEAAIRLVKDAEVRCPDLPLARFGGSAIWLRHQHDAVELPAVWKTVGDDLPTLRAAVVRTLALPVADLVEPAPD